MEFNDEELKIKILKELELNEEYFIQMIWLNTHKNFMEKYNGNYKHIGPYKHKYSCYVSHLFENENKDIIEIRESCIFDPKHNYIFEIVIKIYDANDGRVVSESWGTCNIFKLTNEYILK
jgi:hypothetical protein